MKLREKMLVLSSDNLKHCIRLMETHSKEFKKRIVTAVCEIISFDSSLSIIAMKACLEMSSCSSEVYSYLINC